MKFSLFCDSIVVQFNWDEFYFYKYSGNFENECFLCYYLNWFFCQLGIYSIYIVFCYFILKYIYGVQVLINEKVE